MVEGKPLPVHCKYPSQQNLSRTALFLEFSGLLFVKLYKYLSNLFVSGIPKLRFLHIRKEEEPMPHSELLDVTPNVLSDCIWAIPPYQCAHTSACLPLGSRTATSPRVPR